MSGERIPIVYYEHKATSSGRYFFGRVGIDENVPVEELPPGAAWYRVARRQHVGPDGEFLYVMTPGGLWGVDGQANNCTRPGDERHQCWVRHGSPKDGTLHVDKDGDTCGCGASIGQGPGYSLYHGFLHHGELVSC